MAFFLYRFKPSGLIIEAFDHQHAEQIKNRASFRELLPGYLHLADTSEVICAFPDEVLENVPVYDFTNMSQSQSTTTAET